MGRVSGGCLPTMETMPGYSSPCTNWVAGASLGYDRLVKPKHRGPGLAKARRGSRVRGRHPGEALSRQAEEDLFVCSEVMSEGSIRCGPEGDTYFGSTMFTVDLGRLARSWRGPLDGTERERLRRMVEGSVRVKLRAMRIACAEASHRLPDRLFGTAAVETTVHLRGEQLHIDVDIEVPLGAADLREGKR